MADRAQLEYVASAGYGLENADASELLVLLHGLGADRAQPLDLIPDAARLRLTTLAIDFRAHGDTRVIGGSDDFTLDGLLADLIALVRSLGQADKPAHLVGISMGAGVALRAAATRSFDLRSLTLVRPAFTDESIPDHLAVMHRIAEFLDRPDPDAAADEFATTAEYLRVASVSAASAESLRRQFSEPRARERAVRFHAVPSNVAYRHPAELQVIDAPTLVVGARDDPIHPIAVAETWAAAIPEARLASVVSRDVDAVGHRSATRTLIGEHLLHAVTGPGG